MKSFLPRLAFLVSIIGVALQAFVCFAVSEGPVNGFLIGLFLAGIVPYLIGLLIVWRWPGRSLGAFVLSVAALFVNADVDYGVFIAPTSSTEAIALVFAPVVSLIVGLPAALIAELLAIWLRRSRTKAAA
jgi:hypothetical protein